MTAGPARPFLAVMASGVPVAIAMAGSSLIYIMRDRHLPPFVVIHRMVSGIDSFPLLAVPFFILAGNLMNNAGITNRIYNFALALVGWLKGGLGHVNVVGSVIFAGMSGTAIADAAGLGTIEIKAMKDHGYDHGFAVGVTAASATLGPIIPPSLPFVIYGMMANVSVGQLFLAGILPGACHGDPDDADRRVLRAQEQLGRRHRVLVGTLGKALGELAARDRLPAAIWGLVVAGLSFNLPCGLGLRRAARRRPTCSFDAVLPIMTPVLLIGGMTTGIFTPTEGAIAACVVGDVPRPRLVPHARLEDAGQGLHGHDRDHRHRAVHRRRRVDLRLDADGDAVTDAVAALGARLHHSPWVFLLLANLLMLFVGCFLEPTAAITILVPILMPICSKLGIDPVHFGLVMVLNLMIGLLHPPMGMVLFVLARVAKLSLRAHHDGDPAVAGSAAAQPDPHHLRPGDLAVAAEDFLLMNRHGVRIAL